MLHIYILYIIYIYIYYSGRYLGQTGLQGVIVPGQKAAMREDLPTMGTLFRDAEYSTYLVGKWHLGHTRMSQTPNRRGYDYFFGVLGAAIDHFSKEAGVACATAETKGYVFFGENCSVMNGYDLQENGTPYIDRETFAGDLYASKAVAAIEAHDSSTPMLMQFHHNAPHTPLQPPERM
jgi:arylsulfatase B